MSALNMNRSTRLKVVGVGVICALLATVATFSAPGLVGALTDHFSPYFDAWFNGLSPHRQEMVKVIGRCVFPVLGGVMGAIAALVQARRNKKAEQENEI